ncbi:MAG: hypothetical protein PHR64_02810 [Candidatus Shapirobacteria bacterium]|nr:hypothetical protein [Candidatus Shapirobacteria bacterium]MDD5074182.1 hypothetical protein [Candidatus Shapirobacteria bacterium]MDD5481853.1 hypothetical protein [Candidatus Shapirobacteria bacterium]
MINEELVAYVNQQRQAGVSDQAIREAIISVGWSQQDADEALVASSAQTVEAPTPSGALEKSDQALPSQETTLEEPVVEKSSLEAVSQEAKETVVQEEVSDQGAVQESVEESREVLPEHKEPHQQEDYLVSPSEEPAITLGQEAASSQEESPLEETGLTPDDSQPEPIELNDEGRPVTGEADQAPDQEQPLKTEDTLAKPVSFSSADQESAPQQESAPVEEANLSQESENQQSAPQESTPIKEPAPTTNQEPGPIQNLVSTPQEGSSQVAIDPKAQDK